MDRMTEFLRKLRHAPRAVAIALALLSLALTAPAHANSKYAGLVVDVISGKTLYEEYANSKRYPASLTKIMTLYIVFEEMKAGRINLDTQFTVSKYAAARPPSKIGFKPGGTIKVRDAIKSLVTKSANDVATAVAENISGSESAFAKRMTQTAKRLGMARTQFRNASGLPDPRQYTTARDMATLGIAIQRDFPQYYGIFQTRVFRYGKRSYRNHNRLLGRVEGVDGIKTGYIRASGFNLVTSVRRDGRHIVAVVMGGKTGASRNRHMTDLVGRYLPKATRGKPMMIAQWNDKGPAPKPSRKPVDALLVARLKKADEPAPLPTPSDGIGNLLAFASETRAAVSPAPITGVVQAISAQTSDAPMPPRPAATPSPAAAPSPTANAAPIALASLEQRASKGDPSQQLLGASRSVAPVAQAQPVQTKFDAAFGAAEPGDAGEGIDALVAALSRRSGTSTVTIGSGRNVSAPGPGGPGNTPRGQETSASEPTPSWQIQIGAGPSREGVATLHKAAETIEPSLKARTRLTSEVSTGGTTLYRARYAGFATKEQAYEACKRFAHHNRPCWAVSM